MPELSSPRVILFTLCLILAAVPSADATTYHVAPAPAGADSNDGLDWSTPFATIHKGVAAATTAGDTVLVSNGTYEAVTPIAPSAAITVRSMNGADVTLIDGGNVPGRRCVTLTTAGVVLDGFTVMRGYHEAGAGVWMSDGMVQNCTVRENYGYGSPNYRAGGFWMTGGVVSNCLIRNNSAYQYGGGVYMSGGGTVVDCTIISNRLTKTNGAVNEGAGVYGDGRVERCVIRWNSATAQGGGARGPLQLINCLIADNEARGYNDVGHGGGVYLTPGGSLVHCTVVNNKAHSDTDGIYQTGGVVSNTIAHHNGAHTYLNEYNNLYQTGGTVAYSCALPKPVGTGNIDLVPEFVDRAAGDYRLLPGSPCIDTAAAVGVTIDLDRSTRPLDGDGAGGPQPDMGCYEASDPDTQPFCCNFTVPTNQAFGSLQAEFAAYVAGTNQTVTSYSWDFGDGAVSNGAGLSTVAHVYAPGGYDVSLTVTNSDRETAVRTKTGYILVAGPTNYVSPTGSGTIPYATWATAATAVDDAVAVAWSDGVNNAVVLVTNGTYSISGQIVVRKPITIRSVNGWPVTTVENTALVNSRRVFDVDAAGAVIEGLTIAKGMYYYNGVGANVRLVAGTVNNCRLTGGFSGYGGGVGVYSDGLVTNCLIDNNTAYIDGGGLYVYGGLVTDCRVYSNKCSRSNGTTFGGGSYLKGGLMDLCDIRWNTTRAAGGGVYFPATAGTLRNSLVATNSATGYAGTGVGGGLQMVGGSVENVTVTANRALNNRGDGLYMTGGTITNSIIYHNAGISVEKTGGTIEYSCTPTETGTGNITDDPAFVDHAASNYRLQPTSQCIDAGTNKAWMAGASDLYGTNRIITGLVDIGCYEAEDPNAGPLTCDFAASPFNGYVSVDAVFTAQFSGSNTNIDYYWWVFGDGSVAEGPGLPVVTNTYGPGQYNVSLTVSNSAAEVTNSVKTAYVTVAGITAHVSTNGSATMPYDTWAKAALSVQAAIDVAWDDGTNATAVLVSNGTYAITERILLAKDLEMSSVNGPEATVLDAGNVAQRQVLLITSTNAFVHGFTVQGGLVDKGAGIQMAGGIVSNCVVRDNNCYYNTYMYGGGVWVRGGLLTDCEIVDNQCYIDGGGVYLSAGTVRRCTIASNRLTRVNGTTFGAGVYMASGVVEDCAIFGNTARSGGGGVAVTPNSILRNSLLVRNEATGYAGTGRGGGIYQTGGAVESCTVAGNTAIDAAGDGLYMTAGTMTNTIVYHNAVVSVTKTGGTLAYSCTPTEAGTGNIASDPEFADVAGGDYHLQLSSPCINVGTNHDWMAAGVDLDGTNRVIGDVVDMGCYEAPDPGAGPLQCSFTGDPRSGYLSTDTEFTAVVSGSDTNIVYYGWVFGDGHTEDGAGARVVTNTYGPGRYSVQLTVSNASAEVATATQSNFVAVAGATAFVAHASSHLYPYDTWGRAATNVQAAVDAAWADGTNRTVVLVADGVFTSDTIVITSDIELRSVNGPLATALDADNVVNRRLMSITAPNAFVHGFTLTGGNTDRGAAVRMEGGVVSNCVIRDNLAFENTRRGGGGVHVIGGVLTHSVVRDNRAYVDAGGVSVAGGTVRNCVIASNEVYRSNGTSYGGGVDISAGIIENCVLFANATRSGGGGARVSGSGIMRNCTISGCHASGYAGSGYGGGLYVTGGGVTNVIAFGNDASTSSPDLFRSGGRVTYSCAADLIDGVDQNTSRDPQFMQGGVGYGLGHVPGDYRLQKTSPCVDVGVEQPWMAASTDLDGLPRVISRRVEMGAYELQPPRGTLFMVR